MTEPDHGDRLKRRVKCRAPQHDPSQLQSSPSFTDTPMPVAQPAATSSGFRSSRKKDASGPAVHDLARVYELFHSQDWDPRDYRAGSAKDRQAEQSIGAAGEIDDADHDLLLAAFQARNDRSR